MWSLGEIGASGSVLPGMSAWTLAPTTVAAVAELMAFRRVRRVMVAGMATIVAGTGRGEHLSQIWFRQLTPSAAIISGTEWHAAKELDATVAECR